MMHRLWIMAVIAIGGIAQAQSAVELELKYKMCNHHSIPEDKCTDEIYRQLLDLETRNYAAQEAKKKAELSKYRRAEKERLERGWSQRSASFSEAVRQAVEEGRPDLLDRACHDEDDIIHKDGSKDPELAPCTDKEKEAIETARPIAEAKMLANKRKEFRALLVGDQTFQRIVATNCAKPSYLDQDTDNKIKCSVLDDFLKEKHTENH